MCEAATSMHPAYFTTRFSVAGPMPEWPDEFVIISAHATTGERWSMAESERADLELQEALGDSGVWYRGIAGFAPDTAHAEPTWAAPLPFAAACDLGLRFGQDAIFHVEGDLLSVTHCDHRRQLVRVGSFRERLERGGT
jgi:hypothetical protein